MSVLEELTNDLSDVSMAVEQARTPSNRDDDHRLTKIEVPDSLRKKTEKLLDLMRLKGEDIELRSIEYRFARESMVTFFGETTPHISKLTRNPSEHNKKIVRKYIIPEIDKKIAETKAELENYMNSILQSDIEILHQKIRVRQSEIRCMDLVHRLDAMRSVKVIDTTTYKEVSIINEEQGLDALIDDILKGRYYRIEQTLPLFYQYVVRDYNVIKEALGDYIRMPLSTIVFKIEQFANDTHIFSNPKDMYNLETYISYMNSFVDSYNTFNEQFLNVINSLVEVR